MKKRILPIALFLFFASYMQGQTSTSTWDETMEYLVKQEKRIARGECNHLVTKFQNTTNIDSAALVLIYWCNWIHTSKTDSFYYTSQAVIPLGLLVSAEPVGDTLIKLTAVEGSITYYLEDEVIDNLNEVYIKVSKNKYYAPVLEAFKRLAVLAGEHRNKQK